MNLLVTGGAGFIGSNFIGRMVAAYPGYGIINYDKLTYAGNLESLTGDETSPNYTFVKGDICDKELLRRVFKEHDIDSVVHLAAESHVDRSILGPEEFLRTNVTGTFALVETALSSWGPGGGGKGPFIHVSTDEVYGSLGDTGVFTEDSPYRPSSPYAASKAASDHLAAAYYTTYGLPVIITNCSNNYGPYQFPEKLIPLMALNGADGKALPVYGDGRNVRDWIHVSDHSAALDKVLHKGTPGRTYNIGGGNERRNIEIVKLICEVLDEFLSSSEHVPHSKLIEFVKDRPGHDWRYAVDSSRITRELGWRPEHTFEEGLKETVKWYLDNGPWSESVRKGDYKEYYERNYLKR
jgi:dTDP-glucose 4,6-dehydratase